MVVAWSGSRAVTVRYPSSEARIARAPPIGTRIEVGDGAGVSPAYWTMAPIGEVTTSTRWAHPPSASAAQAHRIGDARRVTEGYYRKVRALPALFLLLAACSPARRASMREKRAQAALSAASGMYWDAVRWGDSAAALTFVTTTDGKRMLSEQVGETPARRVSRVEPVDVSVDAAEDGSAERGTVLVRVESFDVRRGRVEVETVEQQWRLDGRAWIIDEAASPIDADRPW